MSSTNKQAEYHALKMARKKSQIEASIEKADTEKGVLIVITGQGKGKSTSGFGMVARALGHGLKVGSANLLKAEPTQAKKRFLKNSPYVSGMF